MQRLLTILQSPQFKLKLFVWLVFAALAIVFGTSKLFALKMDLIFADMFEGRSIPKISQVYLWFHRSGADWISLLPWFIYCVIAGLRPTIQIKSCRLYAGSAAVVGVIVIIIAVAGIYPPLIIIE